MRPRRQRRRLEVGSRQYLPGHRDDLGFRRLFVFGLFLIVWHFFLSFLCKNRSGGESKAGSEKDTSVHARHFGMTSGNTFAKP